MFEEVRERFYAIVSEDEYRITQSFPRRAVRRTYTLRLFVPLPSLYLFSSIRSLRLCSLHSRVRTRVRHFINTHGRARTHRPRRLGMGVRACILLYFLFPHGSYVMCSEHRIIENLSWFRSEPNIRAFVSCWRFSSEQKHYWAEKRAERREKTDCNEREKRRSFARTNKGSFQFLGEWKSLSQSFGANNNQVQNRKEIFKTNATKERKQSS